MYRGEDARIDGERGKRRENRSKRGAGNSWGERGTESEAFFSGGMTWGGGAKKREKDQMSGWGKRADAGGCGRK